MRRLCISAGILFGLLAAPAAAQDCQPAIADADLVTPGQLTLSINPTNPPAQYIDEKGELQGLNIDLANELSKLLCMKIEHVRMDWPAQIPAVQAGRLDGMNTGIFGYEQAANIIFMVPYHIASVAIIARPDSDLAPAGPEDLAGTTSAAEVAGAQMQWLKEFSDQNVEKGAKPIEIRTFATASAAVNAMLAGQTDTATVIDYVATDLGRQGKAKVLLTGLGPNNISMAFGKKVVADAVVAAFAKMREDGTYQKILDKYGMTAFPDDRPIEILGPGPQ